MIRLTADITETVNYAQQQNGMPIIHSIEVRNETDTDLDDLSVLVSSPSGLIMPLEERIALIPARSAVRIHEPAITIDGVRLAELTERLTSTLHIEVVSSGAEETEENADSNEPENNTDSNEPENNTDSNEPEDSAAAGRREILAKTDLTVTFLAFDEWAGINTYPQLLASFILPNHPKLAGIITKAGQMLKTWSGDGAIDGYLSEDPNRVIQQAAALYIALRDYGIQYVHTAPGFGVTAQRVRLSDQVLDQRMGCCLDITLLFASLLEAIGLNPILLENDKHIFCGLWLEDKMFPDAVTDDPTVVSKRIAEGIGEIAVFETTLVTQTGTNFESARRTGEQELRDPVRPVQYIYDIKRARAVGILPLPSRVLTESGWKIEGAEPKTGEEAASYDRATGAEVVQSPDADAAKATPAQRKILEWEHRLLDLGLRNSLINLRYTNRIIPILAPSLDGLEDTLSSGTEFTIYGRPSEWEITGEKLHEFEAAAELGTYRGLVVAEYTNKRLRSLYTETELADGIKELYRRSRSSIEENGANTLYLALGLLRWYETERSTKARYAPIILLPVELVRKAMNRGYSLKLRDEEPVMNITLLEMLKQSYNITIDGLDPLPTDEHGVDVVRVFATIRRAVMNMKGWDVLESAWLGIFSFAQFVMWNDLRYRADDLMNNKVVKSLMEGKLSFEAKPMRQEGILDVSDILMPVTLDASQTYALKAAAAGESFVLHGPPGTGKSQTITALIANALADGKKVLFVAEKMAALSVVEKRLKDLGIGPFCLELHSNKSNKKDVLSQLKEASEITHYETTDAYRTRAAKAEALRQELNSYVTALHKIQPSGLSVYQMIGEYEAPVKRTDPDAATGNGSIHAGAAKEEAVTGTNAPQSAVSNTPPILFPSDFVSLLTAGEIDRCDTLVERLIAASKQVRRTAVPTARESAEPGNADKADSALLFKTHPLLGVTETVYRQNLGTEATKAAAEYLSSCGPLQEAAAAFAAACDADPWETAEQYADAAAFAEKLMPFETIPAAVASAQSVDSYAQGAGAMCDAAERVKMLHDDLAAGADTGFDEGFFALDADEMLASWKEAENKFILLRAADQNRIVKTLQQHAKGRIEKDGVPVILARLSEYRTAKETADRQIAEYKDAAGDLFAGEETDWEAVRENVYAAADAAGELDAFGEEAKKIRMSLADREGIYNAARAYLDAYKDEETAGEKLTGTIGIEEGANLKKTAEGISAHADLLKTWTYYNSVRKEAEDAGLALVIDAIEGETIATGEVGTAYRRGLMKSLAMTAIDADSALSQFSGMQFDETIEQFRRVIDELQTLSREEIYDRLAAGVPDFTREASQNSELGILRRAIRSGGRGMSIRRLFELIPNLLPRLCPCMLMSPLSAAQYLDPKRKSFDIIVFDEASQLETCKAVGAIARAESCVIVGDPNQMPPTTFFETQYEDEDNLETADLTSILDDCLALGMPETNLLWHYRSRHESLIAFSNNEFYENKLYTFPSVNDRISKVSFVKTDGIFDRSRSRTNIAEAKAIVEEIIRRSEDPEHRGESIAVVTFNLAQQNLIDDLFEEARGKDAALEQWYTGAAEPMIIKNIENMQGDERDVILFSITYGPDKDGRFFMNFGPINREGGWRRLNVAVSRARTEMVVFSSMEPENIDLDRTDAVGTAALKAFLQYAKTGELILKDTKTAAVRRRSSFAASEDGVRDAVLARLTEAGYDCRTKVGHSRFRIDIGVLDPKDPDCYVLGILLDGGNYKEAGTARDREIGQRSVLAGLGWTTYRVYTMDWWENPDLEFRKLKAALDDAIAGAVYRRAKAEEAARAAAQQDGTAEGEAKQEPAAGADAAEGGMPEAAQQDGTAEGEAKQEPAAGADAAEGGMPEAAQQGGRAEDAAKQEPAAGADAAEGGTPAAGADASEKITSEGTKTAGNLRGENIVVKKQGAPAKPVMDSENTGAMTAAACAPDNTETGIVRETEQDVEEIGITGGEGITLPDPMENEINSPSDIRIIHTSDNHIGGASGNHSSRTVDLSYGSGRLQGGIPYTATILPQVKLTTSQFAEPANGLAICDNIRAILAHEAPISESLLTKRVLASFGLTRVGNKVKNQIELIINYMKVQTSVENGVKFYWDSEQDPDGYIDYRVSGSGENRRDVGDVPVQEIVNALRSVLQSQIALGTEDLSRETAKALGYMTMRDNIENRMLKGILLAEERGMIRQDYNKRWILF